MFTIEAVFLRFVNVFMPERAALFGVDLHIKKEARLLPPRKEKAPRKYCCLIKSLRGDRRNDHLQMSHRLFASEHESDQGE